jgi:hypothetical protein
VSHNLAERILAEELRRLGGKKGELARRPKSDSEKTALAARLRRETTLTMKAIAIRLHLGAWKSADTRLHQRKSWEDPTGQMQLSSVIPFSPFSEKSKRKQTG